MVNHNKLFCEKYEPFLACWYNGFLLNVRKIENGRQYQIQTRGVEVHHIPYHQRFDIPLLKYERFMPY